MSAAGAQLKQVAALYLLVLAVLCCSLATWALSPLMAAGLFVVLIALLAGWFLTTVRTCWFSVQGDTIAYKAGISHRPRVLSRGQVTRVLLVDRVGARTGGFLVILTADGNRIAPSGVLWSAGTLEQMAVLVGLPIERRPSMTVLETVRELGTDPAVRQHPARLVVIRLVSAAVGLLIAWPFVQHVLH